MCGNVNKNLELLIFIIFRAIYLPCSENFTSLILLNKIYLSYFSHSFMEKPSVVGNSVLHNADPALQMMRIRILPLPQIF